VEILRNQARKLAKEFQPSEHPIVKFVTKSNQQTGSQYFLDSGDKISYFYEEGALDEKGNLQMPKEEALNKIGHGMGWNEEALM
jgi:hypothetical protein